jgi:hypothetical protein
MNTKTKPRPDGLEHLQAEIKAMKEEMREGLRVLTISAMSTSSALLAMREQQQLLRQHHSIN